MHDHRLRPYALLAFLALVIGCTPRVEYVGPDAGPLHPNDDAGAPDPSDDAGPPDPGDDAGALADAGLDSGVAEPPPHLACGARVWLVSGTTIVVDTREGTEGSPACGSSTGPQRFYRLRIPAQTRATITAQPSAPWRASVGILDACSASSCLASGASITAGEAASATFANGADVPRDVLVSVGGESASDAGELALTTALEALRVTTANAECSDATPVDAGFSVWLGEDARFATTRSSCSTSGKGPALYYRARVAPGETISIEASPEGEWDPVIALLDSCDVTTCRADGDRFGPGTAERLVYTNRDTIEQKLVIAVGSAEPLPTGRFDLRVAWTPAPANTTCNTATQLVPGVYLAQDAAAASELPVAGCRASDTGGVLYYRVKVGAGETLVASATPSDEPFDIGLSLLDECGASQCLESGSGALVYTNRDACDRVLWLAVGAVSAGDAAPFDLSIETREPE